MLGHPSPASLHRRPLCAQGQAFPFEPSPWPATAHMPPQRGAQNYHCFWSCAVTEAFPDAAGPAGLYWWHSEPSGCERCLTLWRPGGGGTEGGWPLCRSAPRPVTWTSKGQRVPTSCSLWPCTCLWQGSKPVFSVGPGDMGHCIPSLLLSHFPLLDFPPCWCVIVCACVCTRMHACTHTHPCRHTQM